MVFLLVLVHGFIYPVQWGRQHHPFRADKREYSYSRALMLGRYAHLISNDRGFVSIAR